MPRYFAVGAGESQVEVKNIYMVEIETLECQQPFKAERTGGTIRCVLGMNFISTMKIFRYKAIHRNNFIKIAKTFSRS